MTTRGAEAAGMHPARRALQRALNQWGRRFRDSDTWALLTLVVLGIVGAVLIVLFSNATVSILLIPMVIGSAVLSPRYLPAYVIFLLGSLAVAISWILVINGGTVTDQRWVGIGINAVIGVIILLSALQRSRLGVAGLRGESMLVDLRERIGRQTALPDLRDDWYAEAATRAAGGTAFAGDFFVSSCSRLTGRFEVAVIDVSGKGVQAGTRSLLLSGAFGGILGAVPAEDFLPTANDYLVAQDWEEGFATAVHVAVDLESGSFEVRSAGHPPVAHLHAGSGRWSVLETTGPLLGIVADGDFGVTCGHLDHGDVLLLFTDGLIESRSRDLASGVDRLLGQADRVRRHGLVGGAERLIDRIPSPGDDRALVLIHRR